MRACRTTFPIVLSMLTLCSVALAEPDIGAETSAASTQEQPLGPDESEAFFAETGSRMQTQVYAEIPVDDPWLKISQEHLFAQIWTRPGLTLKERRLISLSVAAAMGSTVGSASHLRGGLESGDLSEEEIWEWLIHFTHYAGYPKAAPVWAEYRAILAERGSMPLPVRGIDPARAAAAAAAMESAVPDHADPASERIAPATD